MKWTRINSSLIMTDRQPSGYEYRIRDFDDELILIAEGRISDGKPPTRREKCSGLGSAMSLADQWESECANY